MSEADEDKPLINVGEPGELHYWAEEFGVDPATLINAVKTVGVSARDVEEYLAEGRLPPPHLRSPPAGDAVHA